MNFLLRKIDVILAVYQSPATFTLHQYVVTVTLKNQYKVQKRELSGENHLRQVVSSPVLLLLTGYGVLQRARSADPEVTARIVSDTATFFYKEHNGIISLIRREQLAHVTAVFEKNNIHPCNIDFISPECGAEDVQHYTRHFFDKNITIKHLITPGKHNSIIAERIYKNIRFYMLAATLALLLVNTFVKYKLQETCNIEAAELLALERQNSKLHSVSKEKKQIMQLFRNNIPWKYSMLCDYLAAQLPPEIILQRMGVQPLEKGLANGEPPKIRAGIICITGYTSQTEAITSFIQNIEKENYTKQVQLKQMKQNNQEGTFTFTIEVMI